MPPRVRHDRRRSFYDMRFFEWEQHGLPYLAYLPTPETLTFSGPLFRRLAIDKDHFPVKTTHLNGRDLCRMEVTLVDAWVRLENNMLRMIDILKASSNFRAIKFPPLPKSALLKTAHEGMDALKDAALATRDRFVFLAAVLAFYISLQREYATYIMPEYLGVLEPGLMKKWQAEPVVAGVHAEWIAMLLSSPLVWSKAAKRRGVIIDYRKSEMSILLPSMIAFGVPVIIRIEEKYAQCDVDIRLQERLLNTCRLYRPTVTAEEMNKLLRKFIPPPEIVNLVRERDAYRQYGDGSSFELDPASNACGEQMSWQETTPKAPVNRPKLETRTEFLARRKLEKAARMEKASDLERQGWLDRDNSHKSCNPPGKGTKAAKVFFFFFMGES